MTNGKGIRYSCGSGYSHPQPLPPQGLSDPDPPVWDSRACLGRGRAVSTASCKSSLTALKPRPLSPVASPVHGHSCKGCLRVAQSRLTLLTTGSRMAP